MYAGGSEDLHPMYTYVYRSNNQHMNFDLEITHKAADPIKCTYISITTPQNSTTFLEFDASCGQTSFFAACQISLNSSKISSSLETAPKVSEIADTL